VNETSLQLPIYLDNNATTPLDPRVFAAIEPVLSKYFGNPASSTHSHGWFAEELVTIAREHVARLLNATPAEMVFTSGGTESNNLALKGLIAELRSRSIKQPLRVISSATEHKAVLDPLRALELDGSIELVLLPVNSLGELDLSQYEYALQKGAQLVSIMLANNEIGVVHNIQKIAKLARAQGAIVHCDATQAAGKMSIDVHSLEVDLLTISAHKIYGPKGVGALYVKKGLKLIPLLHGGGHEGGLRSGTLNVAGIVGFGEASRIAFAELQRNRSLLESRTDLFLAELRSRMVNFQINGSMVHRIPGNLSLCFPNLENTVLLGAVASKLSLSVSSACTSASRQPSYVLAALGLSEQDQRSSIRIGIGLFNTDEELRFAAELLAQTVNRLTPAPQSR